MTQPRRPQRRTPQSEAYTRAVADVRRRLVDYSAAAYSAVGVDDAGLAALVDRVVPVVESAQIRVANLTAVHLAREAGVEPLAVDEGMVTRGRGVDATTVYERPIVAARSALAEHKPFVDAKATGQRRLEQLVTTDLQMAKVRQADQSLRAAGRTFYRRVPKGESTCALCLIAATQRYKVGNLLPIHPGCDCGVEEIPAGMNLDDLLDTEALLESTHAKVEAFTAVVDRGGRAVDYRKLLITHEHGEIGPLIAWDGQNFTGPAEIPDARDGHVEVTVTDLDDDELTESDGARGRAGDALTGGGGDEPPEPPGEDVAPVGDDNPEDRLNELFAGQRDRITADQRDSVERWQGTDRFYEQVQRAVENAENVTDEAAQVTSDLFDLAQALPEDVQVWRGVRNVVAAFGAALGDLEGRAEGIQRFVSTSIYEQVASTEFTEPGRAPALLKVVAKAGVRAIWIPPLGKPGLAYQGELLFLPGHVLRILSVDPSGEIPVIEVEVSRP